MHKFANPSSGNHGNGTELHVPEAPATDPVQGVVFTYAKINGIDLSNTADWSKLGKLQITSEGQVSLVGDDTVSSGQAADFQETNVKGEAVVNDLGIGAYVIVEKSAPSNVTKKSAPFVVTLPYPNANQSWLYHVHVYPKNTVLTSEEMPKKKLNNADKVHFAGDTIKWTITQKIPQLDVNETLAKFEITDNLPAGVNDITNDSVQVTAPGGAQPNIQVIGGKNAKVSFEGAELAKLTSGTTVTVTISAVIADNISGELSNQAQTNINDVTFNSDDPDNPSDDPNAPNATKVTFAKLTINKVNQQNKKLADAKFVIWPKPADGQCGNKPETAKEMVTAGELGTVEKQVKVGEYCVQETEAPAGYVISEEYKAPKNISVTAGGKTLTITNLKIGETGTFGLPNLPLTGATGALVLTALGAVILAVGANFVILAMRRRRAEER
ncbi:SpaH/EbpB family LPXTG-anchored major pilin [Arcanobacterium hippocoleae]|uniref:SpaH/EbpB family LPXTG-anchored major pilin n=1 Tax=Arcanobacterium hippocoleae TaxID=149017 RepID=UPI0033425B1D